ncbi:hydrogenase expression protein HupH [Novosphingobium flavum]|nr:aspartate/glutamate racemase family protein [Novosphingobium aerophilum]MBC2660172.1 hydrogenase expression protein HupH [Novosphingobium aerophilum]
MIIPVPVPDEALHAFAAQVPPELAAQRITVEMTCAARGGGALGSIYEGTVADAFCLEAGASAEIDGCAAVCVNSMSDSGVAALRSRLSIPVVGAAQPTYALAAQLGRRFSILSMWDQWRWLYDKILNDNGLGGKLASVRSIGVRPDASELLAGKEDSVFPLLLEAGWRAIEDDGADVLILGSTTMHQSHRFLAEHLPVPVLNPGLVGLRTCQMLLSLDVAQSKRAYPSPDVIMDGVVLGA